MFYLMHEGQIGLGSNAKLISFLSNIQSAHSLIEYKEIQLFLSVINGNNESKVIIRHIKNILVLNMQICFTKNTYSEFLRLQIALKSRTI